MRMVWVHVAFIAVLLPWSAPKAQSTQTQDRRLSIDVVVAGKDGIPVSGLSQADFVLKDNATVQPITRFQTVDSGNTPTEVILLVDAVNIDFTHLADARSRIERFLKSTEHLPVPTALAVFTDQGIQIQEGDSQSGKELSDTLDQYVTGLRSIRRSSQREEEDRFNLSIKALNQVVARESTRPGRKLIFWVSPGWPLLSGARTDLTGKQQDEIYRGIVTLSNQMIQSRVTLYSLNPLGVEEGVGRTYFYKEFLKGVTKPSQVDLGDLSLQVIATQSGGLALNSSNDLEHELKTCFDDTRASYEISFEPASGEALNEYHHLQVILEKPGLAARTKSAYYARP